MLLLLLLLLLMLLLCYLLLCRYVYTLISSSRGAEVVGLLLDMHILEDEQTILRRRINALLAQEKGGPQLADDRWADGWMCGWVGGWVERYIAR